LLGYPVRSYSTNAVKNAVEFFPLSDADKGPAYASRLGFDVKNVRSSRDDSIDPALSTMRDVPFFSEKGRGGEFMERRLVFRNETRKESFSKLPSVNEPTNAWPYRGFDVTELDQLCAISLAGVCSEILAFGNAEGGVADISQLRQIFNSAESKLSERDRHNRIRFALGFTMSVLRRHLGALDTLAEVMERGGSVEECVIAIETCDNVSGQDGLHGDYEIRRRQNFRKDGGAWVEKLFLGAKNVDTEEDRFVQGKGGGYQKESGFRLTVDPVYAALAVTVAFLVWASSGGLSLH